jgi:hypothetical protein
MELTRREYEIQITALQARNTELVFRCRDLKAQISMLSTPALRLVFDAVAQSRQNVPYLGSNPETKATMLYQAMEKAFKACMDHTPQSRQDEYIANVAALAFRFLTPEEE